MAWTQADLDALDAAIAAGRGAKQITFNDQTLVFHTVDEMRKLRAWISRDLADAAGTPTYRLAVTYNGT